MDRQLERVYDRHIILGDSKAQSWWFDSSEEWLIGTLSWWLGSSKMMAAFVQCLMDLKDARSWCSRRLTWCAGGSILSGSMAYMMAHRHSKLDWHDSSKGWLIGTIRFRPPQLVQECSLPRTSCPAHRRFKGGAKHSSKTLLIEGRNLWDCWLMTRKYNA